MLIQKQPNSWSCLPTAFAIVCNKPVQEIIDYIGHDGSEKLCKGPKPQIGFHIQEIIHALPKYAITEIMAAYIINGKGELIERQIMDQTLEQRICRAMQIYSGVLQVCTPIGYSHALAWDLETMTLIDPKIGQIVSSKKPLIMEAFWIVEQRG